MRHSKIWKLTSASHATQISRLTITILRFFSYIFFTNNFVISKSWPLYSVWNYNTVVCEINCFNAISQLYLIKHYSTLCNCLYDYFVLCLQELFSVIILLMYDDTTTTLSTGFLNVPREFQLLYLVLVALKTLKTLSNVWETKLIFMIRMLSGMIWLLFKELYYIIYSIRAHSISESYP